MENKKTLIKLVLLFTLFVFSVALCCDQKQSVIENVLYKDDKGNYYFQNQYYEPNIHCYYYDEIIDVKTNKTYLLKDISNISSIQSISNNIYYSNKSNIITPPIGTDGFAKILDLNINNITVFGNIHSYIKDDNNVYFFDKKIPSADAGSFNTIDIISFDQVFENFSIIELGYDKNHLFEKENIINEDRLKELKIDPLLKNLLIKQYFN